jgi:hypothetical protein
MSPAAMLPGISASKNICSKERFMLDKFSCVVAK